MPWLESWPSEQPWHCDVCDTTFYGKELSYIPGVMCEDSNCPGTQVRRDVEVMPVPLDVDSVVTDPDGLGDYRDDIESTDAL